MDDRFDIDKLDRDARENLHMSIPWIMDVAEPIVTDLVKWANEEIYFPLGGELECKLPFSESLNAMAYVHPDRPYNPRIDINVGMLREIYRDSFVFPLRADMIAEAHDHEEFFQERLGVTPASFKSGVPDIPESQYTPVFRVIRDEIKRKGIHPGMHENALACRYLMFEVMLVWVFFHELSHLVQRHYLLREGNASVETLEAESYEITVAEFIGDESLRFQAREILADVEGGELTVRYLLRKKMFHLSSVYLLLCAQYCMFNRFFKGYESNLEFVKGRHPHPFVRNELTSQFVTEYVVLCLEHSEGAISRDELVRAIAYLNVKSSVISGVFWGDRYEKMDGGLPSFMKLASKENAEKREEYCGALKRSMLEQLEVIKGHHLHKNNFTDLIGMLHFFSSDSEEGQRA